MKIKALQTSALALIDGVIVLAVIALLAALCLGAISRSYTRAPRIACTSQLKSTGLAHRLWSNDHGDQFSFASTNPAGSLAFANSPEVFRHYLAMSNELVTPKILACPADKKRKRVDAFNKFSNANLSYFVGVSASEADPHHILSGDRNIMGGTLSNGFLRVLKPGDAAGWTRDLHENAGNAGFADGSVQQFTPGTLTKHVAAMTNQSRLAIP